MYNQDIIAAIATPPGVGAIAIIRISGINLKKIYRDLTKKNTFKNKQVAYLPVYGTNGDMLDTCMVVYIKGPLSYTGEDIIEINCHGGNLIPKLVLSAVVALDGVRMAENGEFSKRAFLNGKIDLTQAEAIASLISSESENSKKINLKNSLGFVSKKIKSITKCLADLLVLIEHELDFSEEEVSHVSQKDIKNRLFYVREQLSEILKSTLYANKVAEGHSVVVCGKPNAGKSSLFNSLVGEKRVIVSDEVGTTRDSVEVRLEINGFLIRLVDTAGYMETTNIIDKEAVEKTVSEIKRSDLLLVVDDNDPVSQSMLLNRFNKACIYVKTKSDLNSSNHPEAISVSSKNGFGLDFLKNKISTTLSTSKLNNYTKDVFITSKRQQALLSQSVNKLDELTLLLEGGLDMVIASSVLRDIVNNLEELVGKIYNDQILDSIFNEFCVGK